MGRLAPLYKIQPPSLGAENEIPWRTVIAIAITITITTTLQPYYHYYYDQAPSRGARYKNTTEYNYYIWKTIETSKKIVRTLLLYLVV